MNRRKQQKISKKKDVRHVRRMRLPSKLESFKALAVLLILGLGWYSGHMVYTNWDGVKAYTEEFVARQIDARVKEVLVSGVVNADSDKLRNVLGLNQGSSLVGFDAQTARQAIEAIEWIESAEVMRILPSTLKIDVVEYKPLARLDVSGEVWVIDPNGFMITLHKKGFENLPILRGDGAETQAAELFKHLATVPDIQKSVIGSVYVGQRRWDLEFDGGIVVKLPEKNVPVALGYLQRLHAERNILGVQGVMVDLRLADRIVVRLPESANGYL